MFRGSVNDALGNRSVIFACPLLIRAVQENNIDEIHAGVTPPPHDLDIWSVGGFDIEPPSRQFNEI